MTTEHLSTDDYVAATKCVFGFKPFMWQCDLLAQVIEQGRWPDLIDMPTGTGKTSVIDIALFHLAMNPAAPRRICLVVDRRIVVDAAYQRALNLAKALSGAMQKRNGLGRWARALSGLTNGTPLQAERMRGGMPLARSQVHDPSQPMVITATVDQIGSRLLFRGYGCKDYSLPIHAGVLGMDSMIFLDEAHLSEPFRQTIARIETLQLRSPESHRLPPPVKCVRLSATAAERANEIVFPAEADKPRYLEEPEIQRRIQAPKPTRLLASAKAKFIGTLVQTTQETVEQLQQKHLSPAVAVVVNRIATARDIFAKLDKKLGKTTEVILLIGRNRPLDRDRLVDQWSPRLAAGREAQDSDRPLIVVATQTIEVGADFDFQGMITEAASWDALRQRFGRLDRLGRFRLSQATIVGLDQPVEDDPIYGAALANTWHFLQRLQNEEGFVDFSLGNLVSLGDAPEPGLTRELDRAAVLNTPLVELLCQTSPRPNPDIEVANFLHGFERGEPEVKLVFRAGIPLHEHIKEGELTKRIKISEADKVTQLLTALVPTSAEALTLTRSAAKAWLLRRCCSGTAKIADLSDEEGARKAGGLPDRSDVKIWVWQEQELKDKNIRALTGGELVIVPCEWGGCDRYGVAPDSDEPVADLAENARTKVERAAIYVLDPDRLAHVEWFKAAPKGMDEDNSPAAHLKRRITQLNNGETDAQSVVKDFAEICPASSFTEFAAELTNRNITVLRQGNDQIYALVLAELKPKAGDISDEGSNSTRTVPIALDKHSEGVASMVERFTKNLALDDVLRRNVKQAGLVHDLGKAEDRFQRVLHSNSPSEPLDKLLAKSARFGGRFPVALGERHEAYSVSLIQQNAILVEGDYDRDLIILLVGTHHGRGRPLMPDREDAGITFNFSMLNWQLRHAGRPGLGGVGSGWAERFWHAVRRFGPWGVAYLEAVLRLADQERSAEEVKNAKP